MKYHVLALAAAVSLAGCQDGNSQTGTDSTNNGTARQTALVTSPAPTPGNTVVGIAGPADVLQNALSEQLFGRLIDGAAQAPAPTAALLASLDQILAGQALDVLDALKADAEAGQGTLTAPQDSQTAKTLTALVTSVAGLLTSLAPAGALSLPGLLSGLPVAPSLPAARTASAPTLPAAPALPGLPAAPGLNPAELAAKADALREIAVQLRAAQTQAAAAPALPAVLETVADLVDNAVTVLQSGTSPAVYQANVTVLAETLAANLQALPTELVKAQPTLQSVPKTAPTLPGAPTLPAAPGLPTLGGLPLSADTLLSLLQLPGAPALSLDMLKSGLSQLTDLLPR